MAGALALLSLATGIACAQGSKLNDAQIAHIAYTADQIDIQAAQQALEKSKNNEVRSFAQDMVRDHTAVNEKALALAKKLNVTPEDNSTSKRLVSRPPPRAPNSPSLTGPPTIKLISITKSPIIRR